MLLGQAESGKHLTEKLLFKTHFTRRFLGKSTLQKQFQLYYASSTLDYERPSWRPVV
jgi:hypothetical protein